MSQSVLFLCYLSDWGGQEQVVYELATHIHLAGYRPVVAFMTPGPVEQALREKGVATYVTSKFRLRNPTSILKIRSEIADIVKKEKIDVIHAVGPQTLLFCGRTRPDDGPATVWHVFDPFEAGDSWTRVMVGLQGRFHPTCVVYGSTIAQEPYERYYKKIGKTAYIFPSLNLATYETAEPPEAVRAKFGIGPGDPLICSFGRLIHHKGQDTLARAALKVIQEFPNARFLVCGGNLYNADPEFGPALQEFIEANRLSETVIMAGFVENHEKAQILKTSDILAHPARHEPFGIAVIEGMAMGKPVVVGDASGPAHIVEGTGAGIIVPKEDDGALADAILSLLRDPARARQMGEAGVRVVREKYTTQAVVQQFGALYGSLRRH